MWNLQMEDVDPNNLHMDILQSVDDQIFSVYTVLRTFLLLVACAIIVIIATRIGVSWIKDRQAAVMIVRARVVSKRSNERIFEDKRTVTYSDQTCYYVTFLIQGGIRMEFKVPGKEYGMLVEEDFGMLTFRGTSYLGFERIIDNGL